jgi:hypothetical protein
MQMPTIDVYDTLHAEYKRQLEAVEHIRCINCTFIAQGVHSPALYCCAHPDYQRIILDPSYTACSLFTEVAPEKGEKR